MSPVDEMFLQSASECNSDLSPIKPDQFVYKRTLETNVNSSLEEIATLEKMSKNSIEDLKSRNLWLAAVAEFIGTLLLVLVGCGSCGRFKVNVQEFNSTSLVNTEKLLPNDLVQISLCFGLSVATIVWSIAHVSGGHINPGVTIGFYVTRKISLARTLVYMVFQVTGALLGAFFLKILTPPGVNDSLGSTLLGSNVSLVQGLVIEMFITFVLVWTVFSTCDSNRPGLSGSGPLAIGLSIAMCHLWAVPYTGSGMNPARAFGSHVVSKTIFNNGYVWLYWVGPLIGGAIAALLYDLVFASNASRAKLEGFFSHDYDDDMFDQAGTKTTEANLTGIRLKDSV